MKEIDFIPDWYKRDMKCKMIYRSQYFVLAAILVVIVFSNFIASKSISNATAEVNQVTSKYAEAQKNVQQFLSLQRQLEQLKERSLLLAEIDSKINVSSVLAEISFLVNDRIALNDVTFTAEEFAQSQTNQTSSDSTVRVAASSQPSGSNRVIGNVRFKVTIGGIATDASDVAKLICKLENSPYFFQVVPLYSRDTKTNVSGRITGSYRLNEFQINCYLENYYERKLDQNKQQENQGL
jgi:hypothetical protein